MCYQLLTGHVLIAPFLEEKLKKTDSDQCWWCETGKRQTRDHLFKECGRWKTEINVLWTTIDKKLGWNRGSIAGTRRYPSCSEKEWGRFCSPEGHGSREKSRMEHIKTTHTRL